jgi:anti-anti-sigma factor
MGLCVNTSTLWVSPSGERPVFRLSGKGSFQNAGLLKEAAHQLLQEGKLHFTLDLQECSGLDSTFLGVVAGLAQNLRKIQGSLRVVHVTGRNLELFENMGLDRFIDLGPASEVVAPDNTGEPEKVRPQALSKEQIQKTMLEAHETLIELDERNRVKFEDVVKYLKQEAGISLAGESKRPSGG